MTNATPCKEKLPLDICTNNWILTVDWLHAQTTVDYQIPPYKCIQTGRLLVSQQTSGSQCLDYGFIHCVQEG